MKKILSILTICMFLIGSMLSAAPGDFFVVDAFQGLWRDPQANKIPDQAHARFTGVYVNDGNIQVLKGRDRLNSSANADTTVNMLAYYENAAGTTTKYVVKESDEVVTYDTDWTNRTQIASGLTDEAADWVQIEDTGYFTSTTDGLYRWAGGGSASAIGGINTTSTPASTATGTSGGMDGGLPAICGPTTAATSSNASYIKSGGACIDGETTYISGATQVVAQVGNTYNYKLTQYSSILGIESEPSATFNITLSGGNTCNLVCTKFLQEFQGSNICSVTPTARCDDGEYLASGETNRVDVELPTIADPWDKGRVYRTPAGRGTQFFFVAEGDSTQTVVDGKPDSALGDPLDTTIDTITPPSFRYLESYKGVLFTAEGSDIRFTHVVAVHPTVDDTDTYWLETDLIRTGTTKNITGLQGAKDKLMIFTSSSVHSITGFGADTFRLNNEIKGIGCVNDETIEVDKNGDIICFSGTDGVSKFRTFAQPQTDVGGESVGDPNFGIINLSNPMLKSVFRGDDDQIDLDPSDYAASHAYYDSDEDLYHLYIDDHEFIWDNAQNIWSYQPATNMIASVYRKSGGKLGQGLVVDNLGFAFDNWTGFENGIESGTVTGNPTSSTSTTLTDSGATFDTTGDGLTGLWVAKDNSDTIEFRQISSNTSTALTVSSAWTTDPDTTDTYYVAYIPVMIDTKIYSAPSKPPHTVDDLRSFWLMYELSTVAQTVDVYSWQNKNSVVSNARSVATDSRTGSDLTLNGTIRFSTPMSGTWFQWGIRAWVYNTSSTISAPVNITSYAWALSEKEPK